MIKTPYTRICIRGPVHKEPWFDSNPGEGNGTDPGRKGVNIICSHRLFTKLSQLVLAGSNGLINSSNTGIERKEVTPPSLVGKKLVSAKLKI